MKILPILNAIGCVVLIGFIFVQWKDNQELTKKYRAALLAERKTQNEKVELEKRIFQLQADIDTLKGSIESMKIEAEAAEKKIAENEVLVNQLHTGLSFNLGYFTAMDQAIIERNNRINELNGALGATRKRLDEAIAELKKAGAR